MNRFIEHKLLLIKQLHWQEKIQLEQEKIELEKERIQLEREKAMLELQQQQDQIKKIAIQKSELEFRVMKWHQSWQC